MYSTVSSNRISNSITERAHVEISEQQLTLPEKDRPYHQAKFVHQPGLQKLPDRRRAAANANVKIASSSLCLFKSRVNTISHEVEGRPTLHLDGFARIVGQ